MNIDVTLRYQEDYLPTPRCRKFRQRTTSEEMQFSIPSVRKEEAPVVMIVHKYHNYIGMADQELRHYKERFYARVRNHRVFHSDDEELMKQWYTKEALYQNIKKWAEAPYNEHLYKEDAIKRVHDYALKRFILIDDEVWEDVGEPLYHSSAFGLGHNQSSTCLSISYHYNENIRADWYYNALEREKAIENTLRIAQKRGDTDSLERIRNEEETIIVLDPTVVKRNPAKDHVGGNDFLKILEDITETSSSAVESGLLMICAASAGLSEKN